MSPTSPLICKPKPLPALTAASVQAGHLRHRWQRPPRHQDQVFGIRDCKICADRTFCTGQTRRTLNLQPQVRMQALLAARQREHTEAFKESYRHRAGIEGTHSQGTRTMGLRRSRSFGLHKTHLGHVAIATAINVVHLMSWLRGETPAQTRTSPFKKVMKLAA